MKRLTTVILAFALAAVACGGDDGPKTVRLLTHDSFFISDDAKAAFTESSGYELEVIAGGDAGTMVNQAILTAGNPIADVIFGLDTTFLSRALSEDLLVEYESDATASLRPGLTVDDRVTPIDFGDVCLNYDRSAFEGSAPPQALADLTDPRFSGQLVVQNPATSSPGLAFLLATIAVFGDEGTTTWRDFWAGLVANDVEVTAGWEDAYTSSFSLSGGDRPIVVSYASSPPAEVLFAESPLTEAPSAVVTDGCFRQVEFAGILRGTEETKGAGALIDFLLSPTFQEEIPLTMFVFPARADVALPAEFVDHTVIPDNPATLDPADIEANRDRWISEWRAIVEG